MAELTKEQLAAIDNYGNEIQTLKDTVTAIRQLPGMYAAGKGTTGFLSLIREVAQNSIDQIVDPSSPADRASLFYNEQTLEVEV
jgi:DNA gyrase/topoisomerase IV subunit B